MSHVKIWIHIVFGTKNRTPLLAEEIRQKVFAHIADNCREKGIFMQAIGGYNEHVHCLISLGKDQSISKVCQLIKGEASFWINKNRISPMLFEWQDDYFAVSVSESQVPSVIEYIEKQEEHHRRKSFAEEVDEFMRKFGFQFM